MTPVRITTQKYGTKRQYGSNAMLVHLERRQCSKSEHAKRQYIEETIISKKSLQTTNI